MAVPKMSVELRDRAGSKGSKQLRRAGQVPGVIYGHGEPTRNIKVSTKALNKVIEQYGESSLVTMSLDGDVLQTYIQDIQRDPLSQDIIHTDFRHLIAGEKVKIKIPVNVHNAEDLIKKEILLGQNTTELEVSCLPKDIIQSIDIDASELGDHATITVGELNLPDTIEALHDADETVVQTYYNRTSEEPEEEAAEEVVQPVFDTGADEE